ncbi:hypothetical protein SAMN04515671_4263 [Nakamurella panacisegetis]|uniref:N-acetyltransferase domain-containing protein n=1 Tax=Nakamurella panacisegetis TaxID=1090615 RepID=A0A1H0SS04_9ACTN|nr:hypothetical protein [Nakamurella panacisegetis]SDP44557.1 hypothetical protein SAMN04515671_4263 [Nakamurella panacisegetis]
MELLSLAERPDLIGPMWSMPSPWPIFMTMDPIGDELFSRLPDVFAEFQFVALGDQGDVIAKVNSIPFVWDGTDDDLPISGWDGVQVRGFADQRAGRGPNAVSLLEARIVPGHLGSGMSAALLQAACARVAATGIRDLFGPVRPAAKAAEPRMPMVEYVNRIREDGLPTDGWIRTHVRLGARIVKVCPTSMAVPGSLAQWREWTGLPFDNSGPVDVPGAIAPVLVNVDQDCAVYVEPNVWLHHRLSSSSNDNGRSNGSALAAAG